MINSLVALILLNYFSFPTQAQNIKNFKSQRWQYLLNFNTQHRLLLTGTPLQNNLMELWSLMHFLMPHLFESHKDFKEWFSNPLSGMIEGSSEYNENLIKRLHKVCRKTPVLQYHELMSPTFSTSSTFWPNPCFCSDFETFPAPSLEV